MIYKFKTLYVAFLDWFLKQNFIIAKTSNALWIVTLDNLLSKFCNSDRRKQINMITYMNIKTWIESVMRM
jgi:hypothetical protein